MANRWIDNNSLYIELWGVKLQFDRTSYAINQLSDTLELRIKNDSKIINTNTENGKPFEIT